MWTHLRLLDRSAGAPPTPEEAERPLKALARTDRRRALDLLAAQHRNALYFHAQGILKDPQEAYDVVQETFIRALREPRLFEDDFRIKAWLFKVTTNRCFNLVRDRKRRGAILEATRPKSAVDPEQLADVVAQQERSQLLETLETLSEEHREILLLRYFDDLSYTEIAEVLEVKLGTVMSRLSRARIRLLERLERLPDDRPLRQPTEHP